MSALLRVPPAISGTRRKPARPRRGAEALARPAPLLLVLDDLLRARVLDLLVRGDLEVAHVLHDLVVERRVVLEGLRHGYFLEDRLPGTLGFAGAAVDALVGVDVELVRPLLAVGARVLVDAIDGADGHAPGIYAVATEACDDVCHVLNLPKPNTSGNGSGRRGAQTTPETPPPRCAAGRRAGAARGRCRSRR